MSTISSASSLFTGTSQFSSALQSALQTAITAAAQPLTQMQTDLSTLQSQQSELNTLSSDFTNLQTAVASVASAAGSSSYAASLSTPAVASVSLTGTPEQGSLSLNVISAGSSDTSMSSDGLTTVTDPTAGNFSDATNYNLTVGSTSTTITPGGTSLSDLADAINQSGAAVEAMVVNIGSSSSPDYRLFVQGTQFGDQPIQLTANDGTESGESLFTPQSTGADATYQVNGEPSTPISTSSSTVTLAAGVTATLEGTGATTIDITRSTTGLTNALSNLATAYNAAVTDLNKNHGQSGGALTGNSVVESLSQTLQNMMNYSSGSPGSSGFTSLTGLGFSFSTTGVLSFDPTTIDNASSSQLSQIFTFLGSATGGGFLETATNAMTSVLDPSTGYLTNDITQVGSNITAENTKISDEESSLSSLQTTLTNQMSAADSSISSMEQQLMYMQNLFSATMVEQETIAMG
ncbi:MAG: flagellar filament capping protein FliD [Bryobacteraceae bacterium]